MAVERLKYIALCQQLEWHPTQALFEWDGLKGIAQPRPGGCIIGLHDPEWLIDDDALRNPLLIFAMQRDALEPETLCWIRPKHFWFVRFHPSNTDLAPRLILQAALLTCLSAQFPALEPRRDHPVEQWKRPYHGTA